VQFYLDDPGMSGSAFQIENSAPYDFAGGTTSTATAFNTTQLSDGQHTITAKVVQTNGSTQVVSGPFTVANAPVVVNQPPVLALIPDQVTKETVALSFTVSATDPDGDLLTYAAINLPAGATFANRTLTWTPTLGQAGVYPITVGVTDGELMDSQTVTITVDPQVQQSDYELLFSLSKYRTNPQTLSGTTVSGGICVFLTPETNVKRVLFYLDDPDMSGSAYQVENTAPYDFAGGKASAANAFDTKKLSNGQHNITASVLLNDGSTQVVSENFVVSN
jgi:hypothetical protein